MADYLTDVGPVTTADSSIRIGAGGSIGTFFGNALTWTSGGTLQVWGSIWTNGTAITKSGADSVVSIFAGGSIAGNTAMTGTFGTINNQGTIAGAVISTTAGRFTMENYGSITNYYQGALSLTASSSSAIYNSGIITGFGINRSIVSYNSGTNTLVNNGTIALNPSSAALAGIYVVGADNAAASIAVTNNGLIAGVINAIRGGNGADSVINNGHISGAIALGGGNDTFDTTYGVVAGMVDLGDGDDRGTGSALADRINGGAGADTLTGNGGDDVLDGGADDDVLDGGTGVDRMAGGTGNDTFYVDSARDRVFEAADGGIDIVYAQVSYTLRAGQEIEALIADPDGDTLDLTLTGNAFAQTIVGDAGANKITGGGGADVLQGLAGNDTYVVSDDATVVEATDGGYDRVLTLTSYALTDNVEELRAADGNATASIDLTGNALANLIIGNAGANLIDGGAGADTMLGGAGDDVYIVDDAGDIVSDASGYDTVRASISYATSTRIEAVVLTGSGDIDATGHKGANTLTGNDGDNRIAGKGGVDVLTGGGGADTFVFDTAIRETSIATITDFTAGTDTIALDAGLFRLSGATGMLDARYFTTGDATTLDHHILFDAATGTLSYDRDGSGTRFAALAFASVTPGTELSAADILVF